MREGRPCPRGVVGEVRSVERPSEVMDRLSVLCFAGTYALALLCDLARFAVRGAARRYLALGVTALGWLVHTAYLGNLAWSLGELPVTTVFQSLLVLAWILVAITLYLEVRSPRPVAVALFFLPVVLAVLAIAAQAPRQGWIAGGWQTFWGTVHGIFLLGGAVCTVVAFAAGLMYLIQADRLKHKKPPRPGVPLPSLEQSERWNRGAITLAFPLLTFGMFIGAALMVAARKSGGATIAWSDPKVVSTGVFWLVFALLLHARYRPEWRGTRVMVLTVVAFAFLAFAMVGVGPILPTAHGASKAGGAP